MMKTTMMIYIKPVVTVTTSGKTNCELEQNRFKVSGYRVVISKNDSTPAYLKTVIYFI